MPVLPYNKHTLSGLKRTKKDLFFIVLFLTICMFQCRLAQAEKSWPHVEVIKGEETSEGERCFLCHIYIPEHEEDKFQTLLPDYDIRCGSCHKDIPKICQLTTTPGVYKILFIQITDFPLPLFNETVTCASCHFTHKKTDEHRLTEEYNLLRDIVIKQINPHKTGAFCFLCHEKEPKEKMLYLKYDKDTVRLCKECHNNQRARADNHPVNLKPSEGRSVRIPNEFPLADGKITCVTCHQLKCQGEKKNPYFLRGGPYKTRIETCLTCHLREQYKKDNPHDLISEDSQIKEERCYICHSLEKDPNGQNVFGFKFKAPFRLYCVGCHPVDVQKHPFGAYHTGRYIETIWAGMSVYERLKISYEQSFKISPLSLSGQIMCTTCHNPHDPRKGPKLRINNIDLSCRQCHYRHYGKKYPETRTYYGPFNQPSLDDFSPKGDDQYFFGYRASIRFYCIGCHPNKDRKHPYGIDHNGRFIISFWKYLPIDKRIRLTQAEGSKSFPLTTNGQIACFTCHDPHDARKNHKLRLEDKDILCSLCHPDRGIIIEKYKKENTKKTEENGKNSDSSSVRN